MIEETGKVASGTVDALKSQPILLVLILLNVFFLGSIIWLLSTVAEGSRKRDQLIVSLASRDCLPVQAQQQKQYKLQSEEEGGGSAP